MGKTESAPNLNIKESPEVFQEGMATAESLANMDKEKIEAILEKNPSLIEKLIPTLKKYWSVGKIIVEGAIVGGAISQMQCDPQGDFFDMSTPAKAAKNIIALCVIAPTVFKIFYDLSSENEKKVLIKV